MARVQTVMSIAGVQQVVDGFKRAGSAARQFGSAAKLSGDSMDKAGGRIRTAGAYVTRNADQLGHAGSTFMKVGAVIGSTVVGAVKAAADWESAWAGVTKTVDGNASQMAALEGQLRGLTSILPASHEEIAGVAEAAGQLGIQRENVAGFTQVMVEMGESTNLSADEAATSIAQMMNIMGTAQGDASRIGATIVALGNAGASTERDITQMGMRIAAAGKQVGMSEADVLGFANALASTGVEAEAGGTAISQTFKQIDAAVREGGSSLDSIARTSGMSAAQFKQAWGRDAAGAMNSWIVGLGKAQASGQDVNKTLSDLGMTGIRQSDSILRLASSTKAAGAQTDLLADSLKLGSQAWNQNIALTNEAAKRHATLASQAQIAWNTMKDSAISAGMSLLPTVAQIVTTLAGLASAFGNLPGPVRQFGAAFTAVSSGSLLAAGGLLKVVSLAGRVKTAMSGLGISMKAGMLGMGAIGVVITGAALALNAWISKQQKAKETTDSYTQALQGQTQAINEATIQTAAKNLQDAGAFDAGKKLGLSSAIVTRAALNQKDAMQQVAAATAKARAEMAEISSRANDAGGMASLEKTPEYKQAQAKLEAAKKLGAAIKVQNDAFGTAVAKQKELQDAVDAAGPAEQQSAEQKKKVAQASQEAAQAMDALIEATQSYGNLLLQMSGNAIGVESAIDQATEALKKNGKNLDIDTEAGRANMQALNGIAQASMQQVKTMAEAGASTQEMSAATAKARKSFIDTAQAMGMPAAEAKKLADAYFAIPKEVNTTLNTHIKGANEKQVAALQKEIDKLPAEKRSQVVATANTKGYAEAKKQLDEFQKQLHTLTHTTKAGVTFKVSSKVDRKEYDKFVKDVEKLPKEQQQKLVQKAETNFPEAQKQLQQFLAAIPKDKEKTVKVHASLQGADKTKKDLGDIEVTARTINGKKCLIPVSSPGADGTKVAIKGVTYEVKTLDGHQVLVPVSAPGASQAQGALMGVNAAAQAANARSVTIPTSTPGTSASTGLLNGLHAAWARITGRSVRIGTSAPGASAATGQINSLRAAVQRTNGAHATVTASASTGAAESALRALEATRHMTVVAHVQTVETVGRASGGPIPRSSLASGGRVPGWSPTTTADNVPIMATAGEWMHPVSAVRKYGPGFMEAVRTGRFPVERAQGFANGGSIGGQHLATGGFVGALASSATRTIVVRMAAADGSFADLSRALAAQTKAQQAATRAGNAWRRARGKNRAKAGEAYNKAKDNLKTATDNAQQAIDAFAQSASQAASTMSSAFRSGGSAADLMANMREGTNQLALFESQLSKLRTMGLSQSAIDSLTAMGVNQGSALAGEIVSGGKGMVDSLNLAAYRLDQIADKLGRQSLAKFGIGGTVNRATLAVVGESGAESIIPHDGSARARELWLNAGREIGMLGDGSTYHSSSPQTVVVQAPDVVMPSTVVLNVPGLGTAIRAEIVSAQTTTARNVARSRR